MGGIVKLLLFVIYFVVFTNRLLATEAFSLTNMLMSGGYKNFTTTTSKPLEEDYEVEDLEDEYAEADGEDDGNSGLLAMLNGYVSSRRPNRPTNGHSKPENNKPYIIAPHNHHGKPTFTVTKTLIREVTRRVTVHPVCVTVYGDIPPCISDGNQHPHMPTNPQRDLKDYNNNYGSMETEYLISEPEYANDYDSAYLQPSEFSIFDGTDKEDIIIDSRVPRYLKMYTQTPTFINKHPTIISDQIDEDSEKYFHHATKKTVTKTILATKIRRVPNLQVTATLVAQNCLPASYLSHPWCKENPHRATDGAQEDDTFEPDLDIRKNEESVIEKIDLSRNRNDVKNVSVGSVEGDNDIDLIQQEMLIDILSSELVPHSHEDVLWSTEKSDVNNNGEFNSTALLEDTDATPIQTVVIEDNSNSEELVNIQNMHGENGIPKKLPGNSTIITATEDSESESENSNEDDGVDDIIYDPSSAETMTENIIVWDLTTRLAN